MKGAQPGKSYGQFCGLARSLDHVGDRWTLLIVRELLLGAAGFGALQAALPGLASNLLVQRLGDLEADGLVRRSLHPARSKAVRYALTECGRALEPVLIEFIRWGTVWMESGPGDDLVDPRWTPLALRALLDRSDVTSPAGALAIDCDGEHLTVSIGPKGRTVTPGAPATAPRAVVRGSLPAILSLATRRGARSSKAPVSLEGDRTFAKAALSGVDTVHAKAPRLPSR